MQKTVFPQVLAAVALLGACTPDRTFDGSPARTILSVRYEGFNLNDLAPGRNRRLAAAVAYRLNGWNSVTKT